MPSVTELLPLDAIHQVQRLLRAELARLRRRLYLQLLFEFATDAVIVVVAVGALLVLLDWQFRLSLPVRIALLILSQAGVVAFLAMRALGRWRASRIDELSLAVTLDRYRPGVGQQVADVLQLPGLLDEPGTTVSPAMVRLAVQQASAALAGSDWRSLWNRTRTGLHVGAVLVGLFVPFAFGLIAPDAARLSAARWLHNSVERWPQATYLTVMGLDARGRLVAPRDERFVMEVRTDLPLLKAVKNGWSVEGRGEPLFLSKKPEHSVAPEAVQVRERAAGRKNRAGTMINVDPVRFRYEFPPAPTSSTIELSGGDDWLGPIKVERVDRPSLVETRLRVKEPGSPGNDWRSVDDSLKQLLFLPDTEVELTLKGSEKLAGVELKVHPASPPELKQLDERTFSTSWILRDAMTLEIVLTSAETGLTSRPTFLSLGLLRDREPRVTLCALGIGSRVTPVATIPLNIAAVDDLGLASLRLQIERTVVVEEKEKTEPKTQRTTIPLPLPASPTRPILDHQVRHDVVLQSDPPKIGAVLRFTAIAEDRCARRPDRPIERARASGCLGRRALLRDPGPSAGRARQVCDNLEHSRKPDAGARRQSDGGRLSARDAGHPRRGAAARTDLGPNRR